MALLRDYELPGTGLVVPNAYHVVTKVDVTKRMKDIPPPHDSSRDDGLTDVGDRTDKEIYWKSGYIGTISVTVWKDYESRINDSNPIGYIGVNPTDNIYNASMGTEGMDDLCKFFINTESTQSQLEQAYSHLLATEYYSGSTTV